MSQSLVMNMVLPMLIASAQNQSASTEPQITVTEEVRVLLNTRDEIGIDALLEALDALGRKGDDSALELLGEIYAGAAFDYERDSAKACSYFGRVTQVRPDTLHNLDLLLFRRWQTAGLHPGEIALQTSRRTGLCKSQMCLWQHADRSAGWYDGHRSRPGTVPGSSRNGSC